MSSVTFPRPTASHDRLVAVLLWLAAILWVVAYLQHPPGEGVSLARTMQVAVQHTFAWRWSHLGIAAGYLAAGVAALLRRRALAGTARAERAAWMSMAVASVPLVAYLVVEATVATDAALAGDLAAFELWYGVVAVWTWRVSWPVFFGAMAMLAVMSLRASSMPRWSSIVAIVGAGYGVLAPVLSAAGLSGLSYAAFVTPLAGWFWLAVFGVRMARSAGTRPRSLDALRAPSH